MFIKNWEATPVENTKKVPMNCAQCNNFSEHEVYEAPQFGVGILFMKKPLLAIKKYYLVCPTCHNPAKELSGEQARAYKL